jgi:outer membrane protein OmpA-like peptidoglycan-associated protein
MIWEPKGRSAPSRDDAEKPFWISYADLMTSLMVLFLVAMSVALLAITRKVSEAEQAKKDRDAAIEECMDSLANDAQTVAGVTVDKARRSVDFGSLVNFEFNSSVLSVAQQDVLREFVPKVLRVAEREHCNTWLRRVVVEGFTDQTGTYLYNLTLSLERSRSVMCAIFDPKGREAYSLTAGQLEQVQGLFLVGGYSFNSARSSAAESRRIEMRLEFYGIEDRTRRPDASPTVSPGGFGAC